MKNVLIFLIILSTSINLYAQSVDCETALPVCSNGDINENSFGSGIDDFANTNNDPDCLLGDEHQSLWLFIQIASGNNLGFDINPNGSDDYDFAVYGPNVDCDNLGEPLRCSYAAPSLFGGGDPTGLNSSSSDLSESASGDGYVRWLDVTAGETYYILVDNFSSSSVGFNLEWTGDAILNCDVTLPCPVVDLGNDTTLCGGGSLVLGGPSSPLEDYVWNTGATTSAITVDEAGTYILSVTKDTCTISDTIVVSFASELTVDLGQDVVLCDGESVTFDASHPNATSYLWQDGSTNATYISNSSETVSVVVSNEGCSVTDEVDVTVQSFEIPSPNISGVESICPGETETLTTPNVLGNSYNWSTGESGNTITITSGGIYWVEESNDCFSTVDTFIVEQLAYIDVELGNDTALCIGETLTLDVTDENATSYLWQDGSTNATFTVTESGTYSVEVSSGSCVTTDEINVVIDSFEEPSPNIQGPSQICFGDVMQLSTEFNENHYYLWSTGETTNSIDIIEGGVYWVTESNPCFTKTDTFTVEGLAFVPVELGDDLALCVGDTVMFNVFHPEATGYLWQDGSTDATFTVTVTGTYFVEVTNDVCTTYDTINVVVDDFEEPNPEIIGESLICDEAEITLSVEELPFHSYSWSTGETESSITVDQPGYYSVEVSNSCYSVVDSILINSGNSPTVTIVGNLEICDDESTELSVVLNDDESIEWSNGDETSVLTVFDAGVYIATVTNQCGSVSDTVEVVETECECNYFIPNAFTPNGDNLNDVFQPRLSSSISNVRVQVFNRWGNLVFEEEGATFSWDGIYEGKPVPSDVYSYYVEMDCDVDGQTLIQKGALTILR